jgi:hypothetical protein
MKIKELKQEVQKCSLMLNRSKQELLEQLGVPASFEEMSYEKHLRELNKLQKKPKGQVALDKPQID